MLDGGPLSRRVIYIFQEMQIVFIHTVIGQIGSAYYICLKPYTSSETVKGQDDKPPPISLGRTCKSLLLDIN